ncbi:MAG: serine acetyltransferase [Bacteroidales bacterium]
MERTIQADLYRYGKLTGVKGFIKGWARPGFRYTFFLRKITRHNKYTLKGIFYRLLRRLFAYKEYQISAQAEIGEGFYLYHRGTVFIGPVRIGKNCCVSHNVTIGRAYKNGQIGRPVIGDNVWIGPGAVVVGKINIGNNVFIAPNSVVNFDVPDNAMVAGYPARFIIKEDAVSDWVNDILE